MISIEKKKIGRPTQKPKNGRFEMRTSEEEEKMLDFCCSSTGKKRAEIMRMGLKKVYEELRN